MTNEEEWMTGDLSELAETLRKLEESNPEIRKAAEDLRDTISRLAQGRIPHPLPCKDPNCQWHHPKEN